MRVREVIALASRARGGRHAAYAGQLCERLELDPGRRVRELSLGNRKKVSIVCALQHRPELILLDEPTGGLDPLMQQVFWQIIAEQQQGGATIFLSSHVLSEVQQHCGRAAIIREGRIIVDDTIENLARTSARRVTLRGLTAAPALDGIVDVQTVGSGVSFLYSGPVAELLAALQGLPLSDLTIVEPELEELFLHFYRNGGTV
ncbi:MAG: ABC transporter ATP-binding protein [Clostridia bacterium]|nr:ABC transporter ATP-binding protein [Clostridia bacterium]